MLDDSVQQQEYLVVMFHQRAISLWIHCSQVLECCKIGRNCYAQCKQITHRRDFLQGWIESRIQWLRCHQLEDRRTIDIAGYKMSCWLRSWHYFVLIASSNSTRDIFWWSDAKSSNWCKLHSSRGKIFQFTFRHEIVFNQKFPAIEVTSKDYEILGPVIPIEVSSRISYFSEEIKVKNLWKNICEVANYLLPATWISSMEKAW